MSLSNGWHHLALVVASEVPHVFVDGTERALSEDWYAPSAAVVNFSGLRLYGSKPITVMASVFIDGSLDGEIGSTLTYFAGELDDFRITKSVALYTANFTPPTAAFPTQGP